MDAVEGVLTLLPKVRHEEPIGSIDLPHASLRGETPLAAPHSPQNAAQAMRTLFPKTTNLSRKARDKRETTRDDPARDVLLVPDDYGHCGTAGLTEGRTRPERIRSPSTGGAGQASSAVDLFRSANCV